MKLSIDDFRNSSTQPVIIIGMHRSGTSLLAKLLLQCGLFIGKDLEQNYESMLFMSINNAIFTSCNSTWSRPFGVHFALQNDNRISALANSTINYLSDHGVQYFGVSGKGTGEFPNINYLWGWKDPRNTFTLPIWKKLFPGLKIIHIIRHGVDVAQSLYQRDWVQNPDKNNYTALSTIRDQFGILYSRPCVSIEQAFLLWEEYVEKAVQQTQTADFDSLQIKYENLLGDADTTLKQVLSFCGLNADAIPENIINNIDKNRAYPYKHDPALSEFACQWSQTLARFDYRQ